MKLPTKAFAKTIAATTAAGAMAVSAVPAHANGHHKDRVSTGEVIAGAVIIGGLAAVLASKKKNRHNDRYDHNNRYDHNDRRDNRRFRKNDGFNNNGPRRAVNQCVRGTEKKASFNGFADVTQIRDVKRTRYGYRVRGNLLVTNGRGYNRYSDKGRFTCFVDSGRISEIKIRGIR